jgi:beta-lactam-binding protein with PASTA domain
MNAIRVLFTSLLMLTAAWANPTWAQVGSTPVDSAPAANVNVSSDWAKKDVKVPNVVGLWRDEAILDLFKARLHIGDVREETTTAAADHHVISEYPTAGTESRVGSKVDLVIARAPEVKVPDVIGLTLSAANAVLHKVDLKIGRIEERHSATVAAGLIISQHPQAGTTVREDRRVRLVISKGTSQDTVPNVVGATQAVATTEITSVGLTLGTVTLQSSATVAIDVVISESPRAGSRVAPRSPVDLEVSSGIAKVAVPNVVGLAQAAATTAITGAGLTVGTVAMQSSATVAAGLVISESPAAGTSVASGSAVSLVISNGLPLVAVPNVVGLTQAAATGAITIVGLKVGLVTMQSSTTVAAGLVIGESPSAGTSVVSGSAVNLVVSSGAPSVGAPVAVVIAPTSVTAYATVVLNGTNSIDPSASIQSYAWTQTGGLAVSLTNAKTALASFTAPQVTVVTQLTFSLTVIDSTGAKSTASSSVSVSPATASQLQVTFASAELLAAVPPNPHVDYTMADGPPLAGSSSEIEVALTGAVQLPAFSVVDAQGNVLSIPILTPVGSSSEQPLTFAGSIAIPTVPFTLSAAGTTADGQKFAVKLPSLFVPKNMSINFSPSEITMQPGASMDSQLNIYNSGATATFTIQYTDPNGVLSAGAPASIQVAAASSAAIPLMVTYPINTSGVISPTVMATASVSGDTSRAGTATLTLWQGAAP